MALSKSEKELLHATITNAISDSLRPVADIVNRHDQTLYGPKGNNGMRKDVEDIKCWKQGIDVKVAKVAGMIIGGSAVASAVVNYFFH